MKKRKILPLLQLALGIGIILLIFLKLKNQGSLGQLAAALRGVAHHWPFLAAGLLGYGGCILICAIRWRWLLRAQGLLLPFRRVIELYFIGQFFNSFLPGAVSGDFVKAYFAAKETDRKKTEAVSTVFIDRIIGLLGLIILAVSVMIARLPFFLAYPKTRVALVFNVILLALAVGAALLIFRRNAFERWPLFRRLEAKTSLGEIVSRAYRAFHVCISHRGLLFRTTAVSALNHLVLVGVCALLGRALGIGLPFGDYLAVFLVINAVAAIPVTPGGLGTRESASIYLLGVFDVPAPTAFTLSLLIYATILCWSLVGGVVYLCSALRAYRQESGPAVK